MAASSWASRAAALRAAAIRSLVPSWSPSSMRPPGNTHIPPKARREFLRSISDSGPPGPSRSTTTVAAGIAGASPSRSNCLRHSSKSQTSRRNAFCARSLIESVRSLT